MMTRVAALAAVVFFLCTAFRSGWQRVETDFPNYYTAAVCIRKGLPLRDFYDWTWFQRQINFAGIENQLGAYPPHTPLTALPILPLAGLPFQTAKRIWLLCNLGFLGATIWLLARLTEFRVEHLTVLAFLGFGALYSNFLYGQYYVFLLFLLTLVFFCLERGQHLAGGALCGALFALKLYGGPFLLYFLVKRNWKAAGGFCVAAALMCALAIAMFGWADVYYYAARILPRALDGEIIDPYNAGNQAYSTLLRRIFFPEPELNPQPTWNAPLVVFFLQPFLTLVIVGATLVGLVRNQSPDQHRDFAWFAMGTLLISTSTSSYTFILLLLPVALLVCDADFRQRVILIVAFLALTFPLRPAWHAWFPRLWVLLAVFAYLGWKYWHVVPLRIGAGLLAAAAVLASLSAWVHYRGYQQEPGRHYELAVTEPGALLSTSPAVTRAGLFYESISGAKYVLKWKTPQGLEQFSFAGEAFHPVAAPMEGRIDFELVAHRRSTFMELDSRTGTAGSVTGPAVPSRTQATSPDGKWLAYESEHGGWKQIWIKEFDTGNERALTGGRCSNTAPVWELDSTAVVFASDCDRSTGLTALYRAPVADR
jgi:hypothetical protein